MTLEATMFYTALAVVAAAIGTAVAGRVWLAHAHRRPPAAPEAVDCSTRLEESEAMQVLDRVRELLPDLDLHMMKRQVHP